MDYSKEHLKSLDLPNGYQWTHYDRDNKLYCFQRRVGDKFKVVRCTADEIEDGSIHELARIEYTR